MITVPEPRLAPIADLRPWTVRLLSEGTESAVLAPGILPTFHLASRATWNDGVRLEASGICRLRLADPVGVSGALAALRTGREASLVLDLHLDADVCTVFHGEVRGWTWDGTALQVEARLSWPWNPVATVCRDLAGLPEGVAASIPAGTWIPQVFGAVQGVEAVPLLPVKTVRAAGTIAVGDGVILLAQVPNWPAAGRVQVDDEVLEYSQLLDAPPRLAALHRPSARNHAGRPVLHLIPEEPAWVAADHPATLTALRAGSPDGASVTEALVEGRTLGGRTVTVVAMARLPFDVRHAPLETVHETNPDAADWTIDGGSTALDPVEAFSVGGGAFLFPTHPLLVADWTRDLGTDAVRHARLVRLTLAFEMDANAFWRPETVLRVRLTRGTESVVHDVTGLEARAGEAAIDRLAVLPALSASAVGPVPLSARRIVARFDALSPATRTTWTDAAEGIGASAETWASLAASGPFAYVARFLADPLEDGRPPVRVGLFARARASAPVSAVLEVEIPENAAASTPVALGTEWTTVGAMLDAGGATGADLADASCVFALTGDAAATIDIAGLWLEAEFDAFALPPIAVTREAGVVRVTGGVPQALVAHAVEVDATGLFGGGDPTWAVLSPPAGLLTVRFDLIDADPALAVALRRVHWRAAIHAAVSVTPTTRLFADVEGRAADPDGMASPASVLAELLGPGDFANLGTEQLDATALPALAARMASAGRRFLRVLRDGTTLGDAVLSALAESGARLSPAGGRWVLHDSVAGGGAPLVLGPAAVLESPDAEAGAPAPLRGECLRLVDVAGGLLAEIPLGNGAGCVTIAVQWLSAGAEGLAAEWAGAFARAPRRLCVAATPSWLAAHPGPAATVVLPWDPEPAAGRITAIELDDAGRWRLEIDA